MKQFNKYAYRIYYFIAYAASDGAIFGAEQKCNWEDQVYRKSMSF